MPAEAEPAKGTRAIAAGQSVREAQAVLTRQLGAAGIEDPGRDARRLIEATLGVSGADLLREPDRVLAAAEAEALQRCGARRTGREPVSRILGERGFFGRMFRVDASTLDPRPCTETVIEAALQVVDEEGWRARPLRILDVGTGSGALLVSLLAELPQAVGVATDISAAALAVARENAERHRVAARATFLERRSLEGITDTFDLLISNPPYIPSGDIAGLEAEVRMFDPLGALDGGPDGLSVYRELAVGLSRVVPDGWALVEVGAGQAEDVADLLRAAPGAGDAIRKWTDLGQHTRCVAVRTHRPS